MNDNKFSVGRKSDQDHLNSVPGQRIEPVLFEPEAENYAQIRKLEVILDLSKSTDGIVFVTGTNAEQRQDFLHDYIAALGESRKYNVLRVKTWLPLNELVDNVYKILFDADPPAEMDFRDRRQSIINFQHDRDDHELPPLLILSEAHNLDEHDLVELRHMLTLEDTSDHLTSNLLLVADLILLDDVNRAFAGLKVRHFSLPTLSQIPNDHTHRATKADSPSASEPMLFSSLPALEEDLEDMLDPRPERRTSASSGDLATTLKYSALIALVTVALLYLWIGQDDPNRIILVDDQPGLTQSQSVPSTSLSASSEPNAADSTALNTIQALDKDILPPVQAARSESAAVSQADSESVMSTTADVATAAGTSKPTETPKSASQATEQVAEIVSEQVSEQVAEQATEQASKVAAMPPVAQKTPTPIAPVVSETAKPAIASVAPASLATQKSVASSNLQLLAQHEWIRNQAAGRYTIQVFGSHYEEKAPALIKQFNIGDKAHYFRSVHNGKDWYSVIIGSYADAPSARADFAKLPETLRRSSPWVRQFGKIQSVLAE